MVLIDPKAAIPWINLTSLNVDLDPAPFTEWITACGLEDAAFTSMSQELGRPVATDEVRTVAAGAVAEVFGLAFEKPLGEERARWPALLRTALSATLEPGLVSSG